MREPRYQPDGGLDIPRTSVPAGIRRFSHEAMATIFEVHVVHADATYAAQAAHAAFELTDRLERDLSRFIPNSDISRINTLDAGAHTHVAPTTLECLLIAQHLFGLTGGAFDVSLGTGVLSLDLDPSTNVVHASRAGVRLDLGGIGKGYAVDLMAEVLQEWGLDRALVHGGFSSVLALAPPPDCDGWALTFSDPAAPSRQVLARRVRQTALSASGLRRGDHIVDPRSGQAVRGRRAAWALVPRPDAEPGVDRPGGAPRLAATAVADALTTAFMLMGRAAIEALCAGSPGLEAWGLDDPAGSEAPFWHCGGSAGIL